MLHFAKDFRAKEQVLGYIQIRGKETPVVDLFRSNGEKLLAEKVAHYEKFQVLEDGRLTAQINDTTSTTFSVNEELVKFLSVGHQIAIGDEHFIVKSKDVSAKQITVEGRGYADTPKSNHANGDVVYVVAKAEGEGMVTEDYLKTASVEVVNYLQEFTKSVHITERAINTSQKDATQLEAEETIAKINEQGQELERAFLYGVGKQDPDKGRHTLSGLKNLMTKYGAKIYDAQKDLTDEKLDAVFAEMVNKGSEVDTFIVNPLSLSKTFKKMKNVINVFQSEQGKQIAGGVITGYMPSTMGGKTIKFIVSTACKPTDIFLVNSEKLFFLPNQSKKTGEDIVLTVVQETNVSSAVVNKTIRTVGTIKVEGVSKMAYIANAF